jgi:hypothetical protein
MSPQKARTPKHLGFDPLDHEAWVRVHKVIAKSFDRYGRIRDTKEGRHVARVLNRLPSKKKRKAPHRVAGHAATLLVIKADKSIPSAESSAAIRKLWYSAHKSNPCFRIAIVDTKCFGLFLFYKFMYACHTGGTFTGGWELEGICFNLNPCDWFD